MIKYTVKNALISDRIYFNKSDIVGTTFEELKYNLFNYNLGDRFYSTLDYDEETGNCAIPSGSWHKLNLVDYVDGRFTGDNLDIYFDGVLKPAQKEIVGKLLTETKLYSGVVQAPCGFGKSFVGGYIIGTYKKPCIIICHTKLLAYQWLELLKNRLIGTEIGFIGDSKLSIKPVTVAIYHSLLNRLDEIANTFEVVIVDECHRCPAETFSKVVNGINARVKIGLSATPVRKDGLHAVLPDYFGPNKLAAEDMDKLIPSVQIVQTDIPFRVVVPNRDWARQLNSLSLNDSYLDLISRVAIEKIARDRCLLILGERLDMLESLMLRIPRSVLLVGSTKNSEREEILNNAGIKYSAILSTRIFDEGISCNRLDTLLLTCPGNNYAKLEQRIGRVIRHHPDKQTPLIIDFWLSGPIVRQQQFNRLLWYKKQEYNTLNN
jgi:superfamily II DNA or RNA helicase